jgi:hypothetical protein
VATWLTSACVLALAAPGVATAATQSLHVSPAPNAQATVPEAITAAGSVGVPSTISMFAQFGGAPCAAQAGDEAARGAPLLDQRVVNGTFSFTASFTPASAGTYFICVYLDGSAGGNTEHQNQQVTISVGPPPPVPAAPGPASTPPTGTTPVPAAPVKQCVVPALKRHTEGRAIHLLALANCKLGRVYRPSARAVRAARKRAGGRTPTLIVVSQTPVAGTVRIAGYTVAIRLSFGPAPRQR